MRQTGTRLNQKQPQKLEITLEQVIARLSIFSCITWTPLLKYYLPHSEQAI